MKYASVIAALLFICFQFGTAQVLFEEGAMNRGLAFDYLESLKMGGGAAAFDFDQDGDEDIYVVGGKGSDGLFENDGSGHFTNVTQQYGVDLATAGIMTSSVVTGDLDNDGVREIFIGTMGPSEFMPGVFVPNILLHFNPVSGIYENIAASAGLDDSSFCMGAHFFDVNQDGLLDLYIGNYVTEVRLIMDGGDVIGFDHDCGQNILYVNQGGLFFTNMTSQYGLLSEACTLASTTSDIDWDGDPDLIIANDFGKWLTPNQLFRNNGPDMPFTDISEASHANAKMYGMGIAVGDFDEDFDLDFYVTNIADNHLFVNNGQAVFENQAESLAVDNTYNADDLYTTGWGAIFEDFDNDSYLDLFVANGYVYSAVDIDGVHQEDQMFLGGPAGDFVNASGAANINFEGPSRGALWADFNQDGLLDLVTVTNERLFTGIDNSMNYYENMSAASNWIGFQLEGTHSNRDAYGARVVLCKDARRLLREVRGGDSHASQNSSRAHFGLGDLMAVDSVVIYWPGGPKEIVYQPEINKYHHIVEGDLTSAAFKDRGLNRIQVYPNPTSGAIHVRLTGRDTPEGSGYLLQSDGHRILSFQYDQSDFSIGADQLPRGLYTVVIQYAGQTTAAKIILN